MTFTVDREQRAPRVDGRVVLFDGWHEGRQIVIELSQESWEMICTRPEPPLDLVERQANNGKGWWTEDGERPVRHTLS